MSSIQGVLYLRNEKEELRWFEDVDPKTEDGKYVGQIKNGEPCGHGTFTYPNGEKYVGEWKNGKPNGQGTEITTDGSKFIGEFKDDIFLNGTFYDKKGNIKSKMLNGKIE